MKKTVVLNVVGLTSGLVDERTPFISKWSKEGNVLPVKPVLPAVTCSAQATYLTGVLPDQHGIVANGWYFRSECEIRFWRQSNKLVQAPKIWDVARHHDPDFTCANMFWWYNMYSSADYSVTPRPMYPADGRKIPDIYSWPTRLRDELQQKFGRFPLFNFWGPNTTIDCSRWIARASMFVDEAYDPTLTLVYLPHLDYSFQRVGPSDGNIAYDLREIDAVCEELITFYESRGAQVVILSEYGISPVKQPVPINKVLREHGFVAVREELGRELLDAGASKAFAVSDHQIAHIYVNDTSLIDEVYAILMTLPGVAAVLEEEGKRESGLAHPRSGELVAVAEPDAWFTYYYWLDNDRAPDFARTVDIHRKPGYDPVELLVDPEIRFPRLHIARRLLEKNLGFRYLMDVIPLDPTLVKGSHGHIPQAEEEWPVLISRNRPATETEISAPTDVFQTIMRHLRVNT